MLPLCHCPTTIASSTERRRRGSVAISRLCSKTCASSPSKSAGKIMAQEIKVPDIGDFKSVPVIEVLVKAGDAVKAEDPLIVLESDKATMEVPAPAAGVVGEVKVKVGDKVGEGRADLDARRRRRGRGGREVRAAAPPAPAPAASRARRRRSARRSSGAGRGSRRLFRRLPRRRPRRQGGAGRTLSSARRRLPQCRLHSVQGAAARRESHRRGARILAPTASLSPRRRSIWTNCAAGRTASSNG